MVFLWIGVLWMLLDLSFLEISVSFGFVGGFLFWMGTRLFPQGRSSSSIKKCGIFSLVYLLFDAAHTLAVFLAPEKTLLLFLLFLGTVILKVLTLSYLVFSVREQEAVCGSDFKGHTLSKLANLYIIVAGASLLSYYSSFFSFFTSLFSDLCAVLFALFLLISFKLYRNYRNHIPLKKEQII